MRFLVLSLKEIMVVGISYIRYLQRLLSETHLYELRTIIGVSVPTHSLERIIKQHLIEAERELISTLFVC